MPWPWRGREPNGDSLLPLSVPGINGIDRDYDFASNGAVDHPRSPSRSGLVRTTSAQSRVSPWQLNPVVRLHDEHLLTKSDYDCSLWPMDTPS